MTYQEYKPYVVSADCKGLLKDWALKNRLTLPNDDYFSGMLKDLEITLKQYFSDVDIVPEDFLRKGLNGFVQNSTIPVVSLDRAYINPKQRNLTNFLDVTRTVDASLNNTGINSRVLGLALERQIGQLALQQSGKKIALIDDVVFEGKTMLQLIEKLRAKNIIVDTIFSGITIKDGKDLLEQNGVNVQSLIVYDQVVDEICERDFFVGAPFSGRSVVNGRDVVEGAPYLYPFGKPVEWASIPSENAEVFSLFCLYQSLTFWTKTEQLSNKSISTNQIAKPVFGLEKNISISCAISKVLKGGEKSVLEKNR